MPRLLVVAALLIASSHVAIANVGAPTFGGQQAGEPAGIVDVAITHEELVIDLRPLAQQGLVTVAATYHLDNRATAKRLDLVFASGAEGLVSFHVTLDRKEIETRLVTGRDLPTSWRTPTSTPLPGGGELGFDLRHEGGTAAFQLDVAPGPHELVISYAAEAMTHHAHEPNLMHQFAYVLSPARTWAGFGGLDVTVLVPPAWTAAITPAMTRTGDTLRARFADLPADAIAVTVTAPLGAYRLVGVATWILFALSLFGGGLLVHRIAYGAERARSARGILSGEGRTTFALAAAWGTVFVVSGGFMLFGPALALPEGQADHRGYGGAFAMLLVLMVSVVVFVIGLVLGRRGARLGHAAGTLPTPPAPS